MQKRPPVVTIMGHVDHGKTSLLDAIRNSNVAAKEFGGITQHVSSYQVSYKNRLVTFIDTPGHEAFTQMRVRGGKVADIIILVVAANEGVKPQTKEAISHAKDAGVPIIVALTKMDLPGVVLEKVKKQLAEEGILVEGFGGDIVAIPVSAKEKTNLDMLLDTILLLWDLNEDQEPAQESFEGLVIESLLDKRKGPVALIIIQKGILKVGDTIYCEGKVCKVKQLLGCNNDQLSKASPSTPVMVLGFKEVPGVGTLATSNPQKDQLLKNKEDIKETDSGKNLLNIILKADVQGTLEAILAGVSKIKSENAQINILYSGVGDITQGDVLLASSAGGIIMGFNVRYPQDAEFFAKSRRVIVRTYNIIYELLDELAGALEGVIELEEEKIKGRAKIVAVFNLPSGDIVCGCYVYAGRFKTGDKVAIWDTEDNLKEFLKDPKKSPLRPLFETKIKKIKLEKDTVDVALAGKSYGLLFDPQYQNPSNNLIIHRH
jgi:translation initiation factor IF-2